MSRKPVYTPNAAFRDSIEKLGFVVIAWNTVYTIPKRGSRMKHIWGAEPWYPPIKLKVAGRTRKSIWERQLGVFPKWFAELNRIKFVNSEGKYVLLKIVPSNKAELRKYLQRSTEREQTTALAEMGSAPTPGT